MPTYLPIQATDVEKPRATLLACLAEVNRVGAIGRISWANGAEATLDMISHLEIIHEADGDFCLLFASYGYDHLARGVFHAERMVNWWTDDPPFEIGCVDVEGRIFTFEVIEPLTDPEHFTMMQTWRASLADDPERTRYANAEMQAFGQERIQELWAEDDA